MTEILIAFITGLTTGGLSCLAVQGGLLASSLAGQIEQDLSQSVEGGTAKKPHIAQPILLFLTSKLVAYTILGFFLGLLGSVLQLTPVTRAILLIAIGVFMIGNALRMFNVHPIFRFFAFEPPTAVTRYIRKKAKGQADAFTPLFLGALTVLIPCGVTQAMMAVALGSGSPWFGAAMMFSFILGTSPVFFVLAYFATKIGSTMEKYFMRFVAVVVLILGLVSIESGLNLMGSPYSLTNLARSVLPQQAVQFVPLPVAAAEGTPVGSGFGLGCGCKDGEKEAAVLPGPQVSTTQSPAPTPVPVQVNQTATITLNALNNGYEPGTLPAPANVPIVMNVITNNTTSCARAFVIPNINVEVVLPETGTTPIDIPAQKPGTVMRFSCSMGMFTGQIEFN